MNKELLERIRYELVTMDGLFASDVEDFSEYWRLDVSWLIKELDEIL